MAAPIGNNPLTLLRELVRENRPKQGTVVAINGANATVRTLRGTVQTQSLISGIKVGDSVRVEGTAVIGKLRSRGAIPVFNV